LIFSENTSVKDTWAIVPFAAFNGYNWEWFILFFKKLQKKLFEIGFPSRDDSKIHIETLDRKIDSVINNLNTIMSNIINIYSTTS